MSGMEHGAESRGTEAGEPILRDTNGHIDTSKLSDSYLRRIERVFPIRIQSSDREGIPQSIETIPTTAPSSHGNEENVQHPPPATPKVSKIKIVDGEKNDRPLILSPRHTQITRPLGNHYITSRSSYFLISGDKIASNNVKEARKEAQVFQCEDEPIHIPGAIQKFGALVAVRESSTGEFHVRVVSENSESIIGYKPETLFKLRCFTNTLGPADQNEFVSRARSVRTWTPEEHTRTNPDIFAISLKTSQGDSRPLYCAIHFNHASDLFICEFEPKREVFQPIHPMDPTAPVAPHGNGVSKGGSHVFPKNKPLHLRRDHGRQLGSLDMFHILCEMQAQMANADSLSDLLDITVGLVYELTMFHRVLIYRFDETKSGRVVSEYHDPRISTESYLNLHFPASDIPPQALALYAINKIRVLYDREAETARLVCRSLEDAETPLDLTYSYLRAMSPIHTKYLENMGVTASMSITLMYEAKIWGLVNCHNHGVGTRVSLPVRELCRSVGEICSTHIARLMYLMRIKIRRPLTAAPEKESPTAFIAASSADLLRMFDADFGFLVIQGEARTIGKLVAYSEATALLQYIRQRCFKSIFATRNILDDCSDFVHEQKLQTLVGMLIVPLAANGPDFLVFFRKARLKEIHWAGDPTGKVRSELVFEPRRDFSRWSEQVLGMSREWTEDQVESAATLSVLYGRFIGVWRQKDSIVQKNRMARLVIRNASHEDCRTRLEVHEENVNLRNVLSDLIESFKDQSARRNLEIELHDDKAVPNTIRCDPLGLRQALSNLFTNAIEHGGGHLIQIGLRCLTDPDSFTSVEIFFQDHGKGLTELELDSIFQDLEQVLDEDEIQEQKDEEHSRSTFIGSGLAFTARFAHQHSGQISMSSGKGMGTRVSIKIPYRSVYQEPPKTATLPSPSVIHDSRRIMLGRRRTTVFGPISIFPINTTSPELTQASQDPPRASIPIITSSPVMSREPSSDSNVNFHPKLRILIAEDNPLNSKLLETRLVKRGHAVQVTIDGQLCADAFKNNPGAYDVILMDLQMPLVNGFTSTRLIRTFEKEARLPMSSYGRIPIIAVSASLYEPSLAEYLEAGFDGWILKPVDFGRLEEIMAAMQDQEKREKLLYCNRDVSSWVKGGWFRVRIQGRGR